MTGFHRVVVLPVLITFLASCGLLGSSFPKVDKDKLEISLQRSACFGSCPDYKVTIAGDGKVVFQSTPYIDERSVEHVHRAFSRDTGVRVNGRYETHIEPKAVDSLLDRFRQANFFDLDDEYRAEITDGATRIITIDTGHGRKTVLDYYGLEAGMPEVVEALQEAIDQTAGSERWVDGTPEVIPLLRDAGVDMSGGIGLELMDAAAKRNDVNTMQTLHELGAPLAIDGRLTPLRTSVVEGSDEATQWLIKKGATVDKEHWKSALNGAVGYDNHSAFQLLMGSDHAKSIDRAFATVLLTDAASNADPEIVQDMLKLGAHPDGNVESPYPYDPPLFEAANGILSNDELHTAADREEVVQLLLDAGAELTHCPYGPCHSVLWMVKDRAIAQLLLDAGADPDFRDDEGEHILFSISNEDVALLLIENGADLNAVRPADGKTLRGWSEYHEWPRVIALLDSKGS